MNDDEIIARGRAEREAAERGSVSGNGFEPPRPSYVPPPIPPPPSAGTPTYYPTYQPTSGQGVGSVVELRRPPRQWLRIPADKPLLTMGILGVLVAIYLLTMIVGGSFDAPENGRVLIKMGAKVNSLVVEQGEWWRLITATFLHGGLLHILLNGYALWLIGGELEGFFGRGRFAAVYAISGLAGSVASLAFSPYYVPGVGASGAIFGLIGALGVYFAINHTLFGRMGKAQLWNIIFVILLNVGIGFSGFFPIDNSAHIGGLVAGAAAGFVLCPRYKLGEWVNPLVRRIENTNSGALPWVGAAVIGLNVVMAFFVVLLLFTRGVLLPSG